MEKAALNVVELPADAIFVENGKVVIGTMWRCLQLYICVDWNEIAPILEGAGLIPARRQEDGQG